MPPIHPSTRNTLLSLPLHHQRSTAHYRPPRYQMLRKTITYHGEPHRLPFNSRNRIHVHDSYLLTTVEFWSINTSTLLYFAFQQSTPQSNLPCLFLQNNSYLTRFRTLERTRRNSLKSLQSTSSTLLDLLISNHSHHLLKTTRTQNLLRKIQHSTHF